MMPSNAKAWEKLIQSCKYFFSKNSICVADILNLDSKNNLGLSLGSYPWFRITNLTVKLWIINIIVSYSNTLTLIFPKLYKTDFKKLHLWNQTISYNDFLFISSNVGKIFLYRTIVKTEDGLIVPLEKLVKALPKIKYISFCDDHLSSMITSNTVTEFLTIPHFSKISKIILREIPETFDIEKCFAFIKKNKITKVDIFFNHFLSDAYKIRVESIIDEILQTENHDYKVPEIAFEGCDRQKWRKLQSLFYKD
uniref:Uncharacterized protein n=1 Tax=Panagrolaimus sp. PS1159 TaxID=55785 RepID=A0AC35F4P8_9BILA